MKLYISLLIIIVFISCRGFGQKVPDKYRVDTIYTENGNPLYVLIQFDSSKYYWKKFIKYQDLMNAELNRLNKSGKAKGLTKDLLRFQDSTIKYQLLLNKQ